jgi:hypothetical protein
MLVVTTEYVVGHRVVEVKGQCFGVVVRSRGLGGTIAPADPQTEMSEEETSEVVGPARASSSDGQPFSARSIRRTTIEIWFRSRLLRNFR